MNDRHRLRLRCDDGCGAELTLRVNGAVDIVRHLPKLRVVLADLAAADGWLDGRCPTCRRWARPSEDAVGVQVIDPQAPVTVSRVGEGYSIGRDAEVVPVDEPGGPSR